MGIGGVHLHLRGKDAREEKRTRGFQRDVARWPPGLQQGFGVLDALSAAKEVQQGSYVRPILENPIPQIA